MSQLYKKTEYVTAMPVHRNEGFVDVIEYAIQSCDASGNPLSTHLQFIGSDSFIKEYTPVRRRPKPSKSNNKPARVRTRPTNKEKLHTVNLKEIEDAK